MRTKRSRRLWPLSPIFDPEKQTGVFFVGNTPPPVPPVEGIATSAWGSWVGQADGVVTP